MLAVLLAPLFALAVSAIQVTAPSNSTGWTTGGAQEIKWTSVSTDPQNVTIQVINPASPNSPQTIAQGVKTSDGSYIWSPSSALAAGQQWRVNLVGGSNTQGILAQSDYFEVKQGQSSVSATATSASPSGSNQPSQTSGLPNASSSPARTSNAATGNLGAPTGLMLFIAGAFGVLA